MGLKRSVLFLLAILSFCSVLVAQPACQAPTLPAASELNLFPGDLERDLGDLYAQQIEPGLRLVEDEKVNDYVAKLGKRLADHFPPNDVHFQFQVIDAPYANAFAIPGGRIFISRKLISHFESEDEMAVMLAHEMAHELMHHSAVGFSEALRAYLGVKSLRDRKDVEDRLHELYDTGAQKDPRPIRDHYEDHQLAADKLAVFAIAAAGYNPHAAVQWWDRFVGTKSNVGNWWTDLWGSTTESQKRLREFVRSAESVPANCVAAKSSASDREFRDWQLYVRHSQSLGRKEHVPGLLKKVELKQVLRNDLDYARFSHNGKFLLVQDASSIYVLSRDPLKTLFRIPAEDAFPAQFTEDDADVVFHTSGLRVERWRINDQQLADLSEVFVPNGCANSVLSPDGKNLACFSAGNLIVFDVSSSQEVFVTKSFASRAVQFGLSSPTTGSALKFSPDGKHLIACADGKFLLFDVSSKAEIPVKGELNKLLRSAFSWLGNDRVIGNASNGDTEIVSVPDGIVIKTGLKFNGLPVRSVSHGDYVLVGPWRAGGDTGVYDLKQDKFVISTKTKAIDVYDDVFVNDQKGAEVALYKDPKMPPFAAAELPPAPIAGITASKFSDDGQHLALSNHSRGCLWDLRTGQRLFHVVGFSGVDYEPGAAIVSFLPRTETAPPRAPGQREEDYLKMLRERPGEQVAKFDIQKAEFSLIENLKWPISVTTVQHGPYVLVRRSKQASTTVNLGTGQIAGNGADIEVLDIHTGKKLWSRSYADAPTVYSGGAPQLAIFRWFLGSSGAKDELAKDAQASAKAKRLKSPPFTDWLLEVVDLATGTVKSQMILETGKWSWIPLTVNAFGERVFVTDNQNRILVYSYSGERVHRMFGNPRAVSNDGSLMLVEHRGSHATLYDTNTFGALARYDFTSGIAHAEFSSDGARLNVVTVEHVSYSIATKSGSR